ncbi:MAG: hypothetical protein WDW36_007837 [Sanguina aurantia]
MNLIKPHEQLVEFDKGKRDDFFTLWQQYLPADMQEPMLQQSQQVELYAAIYFAIYPGVSAPPGEGDPGVKFPGARAAQALPIAFASASEAVPAAAPVEGAEPHVPGPTPPTREPSPRMAHFKQFLETRGSALAHTPAFLAYYALPYVPQPERHPAFEGLYEKRWAEEQRAALGAFLTDVSNSAALEPADTRPPPELLRIFRAHTARADPSPTPPRNPNLTTQRGPGLSSSQEAPPPPPALSTSPAPAPTHLSPPSPVQTNVPRCETHHLPSRAPSHSRPPALSPQQHPPLLGPSLLLQPRLQRATPSNSNTTSPSQSLLQAALPPHALRPSQLGSLLKAAQLPTWSSTSNPCAAVSGSTSFAATGVAAVSATSRQPEATGTAVPVRRALSYAARSATFGADSGSTARGPSPSLLRSLSHGYSNAALSREHPDVRFEARVGNSSSHHSHDTSDTPAATDVGSRGGSAGSLDGSSRILVSGGSGSMATGGVRRHGALSSAGEGEAGDGLCAPTAEFRHTSLGALRPPPPPILRHPRTLPHTPDTASLRVTLSPASPSPLSRPGCLPPRPSPPSRTTSSGTAGGGGAAYRRHSPSSSSAQHEPNTDSPRRERTPPGPPTSESHSHLPPQRHPSQQVPSQQVPSQHHTPQEPNGDSDQRLGGASRGGVLQVTPAQVPASETAPASGMGWVRSRGWVGGGRALGSRQGSLSGMAAVKNHPWDTDVADDGAVPPLASAAAVAAIAVDVAQAGGVGQRDDESAVQADTPASHFAVGDSLVLHGSNVGSGSGSGSGSSEGADGEGGGSSSSDEEGDEAGSGEEPSDNGVEEDEEAGTGGDEQDESEEGGEGSVEGEGSECSETGSTSASSGEGQVQPPPPPLQLQASSLSLTRELPRSSVAHPLLASHSMAAAAAAAPALAAASKAGKARLGASLVNCTTLSTSVAGGCSAVPRAVAQPRRASGSSVLESRRILHPTPLAPPLPATAITTPVPAAAPTSRFTISDHHRPGTDPQSVADPVAATAAAAAVAEGGEADPHGLSSPLPDLSSFYPDACNGESPQQVVAAGPGRGNQVQQHQLAAAVPLQLLMVQESMALSQMGGVGGGGVVASSIANLENTYSGGPLAALEYHAIKHDITGPDTNLAARLLQSLRWRLTRCRPGPDRWHLLTTFTHEDLLGCHSSTASPSLLASLLTLDAAQGLHIDPHTPQAPHLQGPQQSSSLAPVRQDSGGQKAGNGEAATPTAWGDVSGSGGGSGRNGSLRPGQQQQQHLRSSLLLHELARLINAIASDRLGRGYLLQPNSPAVEALIWILSASGTRSNVSPGDHGLASTGVDGNGGGRVSSHGSSSGVAVASGAEAEAAAQTVMAIRTQVLVALQKLSLKRRGQGAMIRLQLLPWLVQWLQDLDALSDFSLEYSMALLMNLVLRSAGRAGCVTLGQQVLAVCEDLAEHTNDAIRTYVNGTLYSIFSLPPLREAARARGTDELLKAVAAGCSSGTFRSQIHHILDRLASNADADARLNLPPPRELLSRAASLVKLSATPAPSAGSTLPGGGGGGGGGGKGGVAAWGAPAAAGNGDQAGEGSDDEAGEDGDLYYDDEDDGFADVEAAAEDLVAVPGSLAGAADVILQQQVAIPGLRNVPSPVKVAFVSDVASAAVLLRNAISRAAAPAAHPRLDEGT